MARVDELKVGMILYFVGSQYIYALLLDQEGRTRYFQLARVSEVFSRIDHFYEAMEGGYSPRGIRSEFHRFSYEWGKQLLPPQEYLRPFDILVIIPHYFLHGLPLHLIWIDDKSQFLAQTFGVSYCSSGTLFTRCVDRNHSRKFDLSSWDYALEEDKPGDAPPAPRRCISVGVDVRHDKNEKYHQLAELFASYFERGLVGDDIARSAIKLPSLDSESWESICIVCHGYYDEVVPDSSGILLDRLLGALPRRRIRLHHGRDYHFLDLPFRYPPVEIQPSIVDEDELLRLKWLAEHTPYPIDTTPRSLREAELMTIGELKVECYTEAQLVALLGCSTGAGQLLSGDDFNSIAYQWLKVGATSVLASLWELDFDYITHFLQLFLVNWIQKRQPKAIAWRQALRDILRQDTGLEPYKWGAIALLGDWL